MIIDSQNLFSDKQAITATAASTNSIDLGATGFPVNSTVALKRDMGKSMVPLLIEVTETFNTLTSLTVTVETDDNSAFSSPTVAWTSGAILLATLVRGYYFKIEEFPWSTDERYVRLNYTVAGTPPTLGRITASVVTGIQTNFS